MKILIVEDNFDSSEMLRTLLEHDGHQVIATKDGREGLAEFERGHYWLVISDWLMPELDGLEMVRRIRASKLNYYPYIILVTALSGKAKFLAAMDAGVDDFMTKPYDPDELRARIIVAERIVKLQEHVKRLEGVLPTCMYCKKIRDQRDVWIGIEQYVAQRSDASFSHGVCPDCYEQIVKPELNSMRPSE